MASEILLQKNYLKRLNLELSALCNYQCVGCPNTFMNREKGHMSKQLFHKIFCEIGQSAEKVFLWNYGEPFLNPNLPEMVRSIEEHPAKKVISTNGSLLGNFKDLSFLTCLDQVIISINGLTQETYSVHQKGGNLNTIKNALLPLGELLWNSKTDYVLQIVAHSKNLSELSVAEDFANKYRFKTLVIKSFNAMDGNKETFDFFVPIETRFSRYNQKDITTRLALGKPPCLDCFVINWNGDVNVCCWDYKGKYVMGNLEKQSVSQVWSSKSMIEHRQNMQNHFYLDICNNCGTKETLETRRLRVDKE